jgi:hypothetical protein
VSKENRINKSVLNSIKQKNGYGRPENTPQAIIKSMANMSSQPKASPKKITPNNKENTTVKYAKLDTKKACPFW